MRARGREAENKKDYEQARRHFRVTNLNLHSFAELDDKEGMTEQEIKDLAGKFELTPATIAQALKAKAGVGRDILRIERAIRIRDQNP